MQHVQVCVIGAGPAGLILAELLARSGIDAVVVERRTRAYVESRIRAGVLEDGAMRVLEEAGVARRMHAEGLVHHGFDIASQGRRLRIEGSRTGTLGGGSAKNSAKRAVAAWWAVRDLNPRHPACKAGALTN